MHILTVLQRAVLKSAAKPDPPDWQVAKDFTAEELVAADVLVERGLAVYRDAAGGVSCLDITFAGRRELRDWGSP